MTNPWNLSQREMDVLIAAPKVGNNKRIAARLRISEQRVSELVRSALARMELQTLVQAAVAFDRWHQSRVILEAIDAREQERIDRSLARRLSEARWRQAA